MAATDTAGYGSNDIVDERRRKLMRLTALKNEQSTWRTTWQDISSYISPRRSRFFNSDVNKGTRKDGNIVNNRPSRASRVLASGMMAGITSPTRPWFRLTTPDRELNQYKTLKEWLAKVEDIMREVFQRSNFYTALHSVYTDLGPIGTTVMHMEEDAKKVIRSQVFPVGQYYLANGADGRVDTVYRELSMTVGQLVEKFTKAKCSPTVRALYDRQNYDQWQNVLHITEPNRKREYGKLGPKGMAYSSCWLELGGGPVSSGANGAGDFAGSAGGALGFLREAGFYEAPFVAPRWLTTGEDVYGSSPGMEALGDAKALQLLEKRGLQVVEKLADPPMKGPSSMMNQPFSTRPGQLTLVDSMTPGQAYQPAYMVDPRALDVVELKIRQHEQRIDQSFFADVWLMMAQEGDTMTATEVLERKEEKMLQLGPTLDRFHDEALDPIIWRVFSILLRNNMLPPAPPEMHGQPLRVEYISILAQAQKAIGIQGVRELVGFVGQIAAMGPAAAQAMDKIDVDKVVDEYAEMIGTPPDLVRGDDEVAAIRANRAKQQQAAQQMQMAQAGAKTAQTLSAADTTGDNALTRVLSAMGGPGAGTA